MLDIARHAQVQFSLALLVLLICLAAIAWRNVFGRPLAPDVVLPGWLRELRLPAIVRERGARIVDLGLALMAVSLVALALGSVHPSGFGLDRGRILHEQIQAKYQAELGWDGLYACAWAADREGERALSSGQKARVLTVEPPPGLEPTPEPEYRIELGEYPRKRVVPKSGERGAKPEAPEPPEDVGGKLWPSSRAAKELGCRERFSDERWAAFAADIAKLAAISPDDSLGPLLEGYGSTSSPGRLARLRLQSSILPISAGLSFALALLGQLAVIAALVLVFRAYGLRATALIAIVCFCEFARSPIVAGIGLGEPLVLAALLAGLAAVELDRWALAGGLLALASVELVWPTLIVLALVAKFGVEWLAGRPQKRELKRFAVAVAATAGVLLLLSASLPGGLANWSIWADRVAVHRYADGSRQVGLQWLFVPDGSWLGGPEELPYPIKAQRLVDRQGWITICGLLLLTPVLLAARALPAVAFAGIAAFTAVFAMFSTDASTYGLALPLLALAAAAVAKHHEPSQLLIGRPTTLLIAGCLAVTMGMHGMVRIHVFAPWLFNMIYSHLLTTLLLGLGAALVLLPGLRERGDPPGAPPALPLLMPGSGRRAPATARAKQEASK